MRYQRKKQYELTTQASVSIHVPVCFICSYFHTWIPCTCPCVTRVSAHEKHFSTHPAVFHSGLTYISWWLCDQCLFPKSCIWCGESCRLTSFPPFSQWMWILTFLFWFSEGCPAAWLLTLYCLFQLNSIVFAELCVIMKWGWFLKCITHQIFTLCFCHLAHM